LTYFTDNPLERLMRQRPGAARKKPSVSAPKGHPCYGCSRYGHGCVAPCYRELLKYLNKERDTK
jgi:hypothetical protein